MNYPELVEKRDELTLKIEKLNESLRFGSSGNISGIHALKKMQDNLVLVEGALKDATPVPTAPAPAPPVQEAAVQTPEPAAIIEPAGAEQPTAANNEHVVVAPPQEAQLGTS